MIHAYNKTYLNDAMKNLGEAVDYAVNDCGVSIKEFFELFMTTGYAEKFGLGVPQVISGMSGVELVNEIFSKSGLGEVSTKPKKEYGRSAEYWAGWILAYYQWYLGRSFKTILQFLTVSEVLSLYSTLHEASEDKCVDIFNQIIRSKESISRLQVQRKICGFSQRELAEKSGVNLRTLQQYELKTKDLSKASASSILALSKVLGCGIEDLLELELIDVEYE